MACASPRQKRRNKKASARYGSRIPAPAPRYFSRDGQGLPGVSEVVGVLATDKERKVSLGQTVEMPGYIKPIYFTRAAIVGTVVHTGIEAFIRGAGVEGNVVELMARKALHDANGRGEMDPREINDQARKGRFAYENWLRWAEGKAFAPHSVEARIVDEELQVGMTADLVETDGEALTVTDWKTTGSETMGHLKGGLVTKYRIQTGAYAGLLGRHHGKKITSARLVFAPKHEGREVFTIELDREELAKQWRIFTSALHIYHSLKEAA